MKHHGYRSANNRKQDSEEVCDVSCLRDNLADLLETEPLIQQWWRERRACALYHKDRDVRKNMPIFVSCVKVFADDTSGNVSKQWNKHLNQYLSHDNLPRYMASMQSHVHFLSTSPALRINQQFDCLRKLIE